MDGARVSAGPVDHMRDLLVGEVRSDGGTRRLTGVRSGWQENRTPCGGAEVRARIAAYIQDAEARRSKLVENVGMADEFLEVLRQR